MTKLTFSATDVSIVLQQPQSQVMELIRQGQIRARSCLSGACTVLRHDLLSFMQNNNYSTTVLDKHKTILIVNDNALLQQKIDQVLNHLPHNCTIILIRNGYDAVTTLIQEKTDLLVINSDSESFDTQGIFKAIDEKTSPPVVITLSKFHSDIGAPLPLGTISAALAADDMEKLTKLLKHFIDN
nr:hypothetical protein [Desulfobulbaceae bacterium]